MKEIILDTIIDTLKLLPFLFIAFLIIEFTEHKLNKKNEMILTKAKKFGVISGSLLGIIPQCGFSVMATNLYITRIITLGTLISIYLSTSDEMLPILISHNVDWSLIIKILLLKIIFAIIYGIILDLIIRKQKNFKNEKLDYQICKKENCHCEEGIVVPALKHTINTGIYVLIISFLINLTFNYIGEHFLSKLLLKNTIFSPFITSLIGLIPNCGTSILLTELYLNKAIHLSSLIGGLLTNCGTALIVLFKNNKQKKENLIIILLLYGLGVISGIILEMLKLIF